MNKSLYFGIIVTLVCSLVYFIGTSSIIFTAIIFVLYLLYFLIIVSKRFSKFDKHISRFHECYFFISNFIVSLSLKGSINAAFDNLRGTLGEEFDEELLTMEEMKDNEKLLYLKNYYNYHIYQLFVDVVFLWLEQGGDIIAMTSHLTNQSREVEEYIVYSSGVSKGKLFEFGILWALTLAIIVSLRFALSLYFNLLSSQLFYQLGLLFVFLFLLFSIELLTRRMTDISIKGASENEK